MPYPFPLIARPPGDWKNLFDNQAIEMSIAHNMFIRGVNAIYAQAKGIQDKQIKPFVFFCICVLETLHHHHHMEESLVFPFLEAKMGENAMAHNVEQHHAFMGGMDDLEVYLKAVQAGTAVYDAATLIEKLDSFAEQLVEHLHEEIATLESSKLQAVITEHDLQDLADQFIKLMKKEISLVTAMPLGLVCHDKSTAPYFPPFPAPVLWMTKYALYYLHSDAWAFGPCDVNGVLKPGFGSDVSAPA
ncbi:hypothetical protein C8F01DRAFT_1247500 [Mycena amicta]|nr:hypothetical protein C8F01DRAFT_1247500 [Mycena amicta]